MFFGEHRGKRFIVQLAFSSCPSILSISFMLHTEIRPRLSGPQHNSLPFLISSTIGSAEKRCASSPMRRPHRWSIRLDGSGREISCNGSGCAPNFPPQLLSLELSSDLYYAASS